MLILSVSVREGFVPLFLFTGLEAEQGCQVF